MDKEAQMNFHYDKDKHEYTLDGKVLPTVTQILKEVGLIDTTWFTESATMRGTDVHKMCHFYDESDLDESQVPEDLKGYLEAWKKFKSDMCLVFTAIEVPLYSETYQYAGTPDRLGTSFGKGILIDIKSGIPQSWVRYQLAAYDILAGNSNVRERWCVQLKPDGNFSIMPFQDLFQDVDDWFVIKRMYDIKKGRV